jgi:hypothetical protein
MDRLLSVAESSSLIARMEAANPSPVLLAMIQALPTMQQAALLTLHESVVRRTVVRRLLEDAQDIPRAPDYRILARLGLALYHTGKRRHDLTDEGRIAAVMLERVLCQRFGIHLMSDAGSVGSQQKYVCCCGQWSTTVRRSGTAYGNAK